MIQIIDYHEYVPRRKALGLGFSNTNLKAMEPILHKNIDTFILKVRTELEEKGKIEVYYWLELAMTNILGEVCYGKDFGLIDIGGHDDFIKSLFTALFTYTARGKIPFIRLIEYLLSYIPHPEIQWFINSNSCLTAYAGKYMSEMREEIKSSKDGRLSRPSMFSELMIKSDCQTGKHKLSATALRDEAGFFVLLGSKSVSIVEEELKGTNWDLTNLQNLPYLAAVIKEVLRLYNPSAIGAPRTVPKGGRNVGPYFFPEGTVVSPETYSIHRDPDIFAGPLSFKPERWENPTKAMETALMPFGGASRLCPAKNLTMMELRLIAAKVVKECGDMTPADSCTDESMEFEELTALLPKTRKCELQRKLPVPMSA
ncbi:hypothetical protein TWF594_002738 [Orbilia oligospora]|nr:hypothetical protein TWF594_002738 [Orbilia oligospora]